jgi:hypothetical protein
MIMNRVIVGLDDSPGSHAAHGWAAAYAEATGAELCAVHVVDWPIGLRASAVKSGTRLYVPQRDVAEPYWRGLHRVFHDISSPTWLMQYRLTEPYRYGRPGIGLRLPTTSRLALVLSRTNTSPASPWANRSTDPRPAARSSRFPNQFPLR